MLVLSRKAGEQITIGESITIVVLEFANGRVRIGIDAPREVSVHRAELVTRKQVRFVATPPSVKAEPATG
jgi:carbon storage regulator